MALPHWLLVYKKSFWAWNNTRRDKFERVIVGLDRKEGMYKIGRDTRGLKGRNGTGYMGARRDGSGWEGRNGMGHMGGDVIEGSEKVGMKRDIWARDVVEGWEGRNETEHMGAWRDGRGWEGRNEIGPYGNETGRKGITIRTETGHLGTRLDGTVPLDWSAAPEQVTNKNWK